jgi:hypothetical protein
MFTWLKKISIKFDNVFNVKFLGCGHIAAINKNTYGYFHKNVVICINSIEHARRIWKLIRLLLKCACKNLI